MAKNRDKQRMNKKLNKLDKYNDSHCLDMTAYKAITNVEKECIKK